TSSSQPPAHSTPILQPTSTAIQATPTPGGGPLTVAITSIPARVSNNSAVAVNTSLPNVSVSLVAFYTVPPFRYISSSTITNGNGNASLSWSVTLIMY